MPTIIHHLHAEHYAYVSFYQRVNMEECLSKSTFFDSAISLFVLTRVCLLLDVHLFDCAWALLQFDY